MLCDSCFFRSESCICEPTLTTAAATRCRSGAPRSRSRANASSSSSVRSAPSARATASSSDGSQPIAHRLGRLASASTIRASSTSATWPRSSSPPPQSSWRGSSSNPTCVADSRGPYLRIDELSNCAASAGCSAVSSTSPTDRSWPKSASASSGSGSFEVITTEARVMAHRSCSHQHKGLLHFCTAASHRSSTRSVRPFSASRAYSCTLRSAALSPSADTPNVCATTAPRSLVEVTPRTSTTYTPPGNSRRARAYSAAERTTADLPTPFPP
mmetsp:Transcript_32848/g.81626  ORF Transcript_32848/g.81626 Transcript_32848/m.81626 type:complete len:271 (-) Transcript_32848:306-1118(-)